MCNCTQWGFPCCTEAILYHALVTPVTLNWHPVQYQRAPLWVHSTVWGQQPWETSTLSFMSCLQQSHVKCGQVISEILKPGGGRSPTESSLELSRGIKKYLVHVCLPINTSHVSKQWELSWLETGGKWRMCSYMADIITCNKVMLSNSESCHDLRLAESEECAVIWQILSLVTKWCCQTVSICCGHNSCSA